MNTSRLISFYIVIHVNQGLNYQKKIFIRTKLKHKKEARKYYKLKLSQLMKFIKSVIKTKEKYLNILTYIRVIT